MANILRRGFRWSRNLNGGSGGPPAPIVCRVADDYDGDLGGANMDLNVGHPVRFVNTGTVAAAAAAQTVWGIIVGILPHYSASDGVMKYSNMLPNQTSYDTNYERESRVLVVPAWGSVWRIQADENTTATTYAAYRAFIGENCDHIYVASTAPYGQVQLDISTHATTAEQWQIINIPDEQLQDFSAQYVDLEVTINEGQIAPWSTTGV